MNPVYQEKADAYIQELLEAGLIEHSHSQWQSPALFLPKKSTSNDPKDLTLRLVIDYRQLNQLTDRECSSLPLIGEITYHMAGNEMFSSMDAASGFYSLPLKDEVSRDKTAFAVANHPQYRWTRLPQGLRLAPRAYTDIANVIRARLPHERVINYVDDWVVGTNYDVQEHINMLRTLFERFRMAGLMLKYQKCHLFQKQIEFLGHIMSAQGMTPDQRNIQKVKEMQPPKTKKQLRRFYGLISYMRKMIPSFATRTAALTHLLKKDVEFRWTNEQQNSFEDLKNAICTRPVITYPDLTKEFLVFTDTSKNAIGGMIAQAEILEPEDPNKTKKSRMIHPIGYYSRRLSKAEQNHRMYELEALAIVSVLEHFMSLTKHNETTCYTDSKAAIAVLLHNKQSSTKRERLTARLGQFDFISIKHIPGEKMWLQTVYHVRMTMIVIQNQRTGY